MHAKPCVVDEHGKIWDVAVAKANNVSGEFFHSKKEAARWLELRFLEQAGKVRGIERQVSIPLHACETDFNTGIHRPVLVGKYIADFRYFDIASGLFVVEDVKGMARREDLYKWKAKHVAVEHGITINEV
jgi:hypothetical protein